MALTNLASSQYKEKIVTLGNSGKWVRNEAMGAQKGA